MKKTRAVSCALAAGFGVAALAPLSGTAAAAAAAETSAATDTCTVQG
jgi:hypothetical protein